MEQLRQVLGRRLTHEYPIEKFSEKELECLLANGWDDEVALCGVMKEELTHGGLRSGRAIALKHFFPQGIMLWYCMDLSRRRTVMCCPLKNDCAVACNSPHPYLCDHISVDPNVS